MTSNSTTESPKLQEYGDYPTWLPEAQFILNYTISILQFFGFTINLVHLSILTRPQLRSNAVYRLMIGICVCDLFSHVLSFVGFSPFWIRETKNPKNECYQTMTYKDAFLLLYPVIVLDITQRSSSWLALLMALFRTLSIMFPMSSRMQKISRPVSAIWTIILVLISNTAWTLWVFGRHSIVERNVDIDCDGNKVHLTEDRYLVLIDTKQEHLHSIITSIYGIIKALPSLIDPILTVLLILELRKARKRQKNCGRSNCEKSENTTKLIIFVTISFFVLEAPNGFAHFTAGVFHGYPRILTISYMVQVFAEFFPVFNASSHFFICFFMSSQYRDAAKQMRLSCCKSKSDVITVKQCSGKSNCLESANTEIK